MTIRIAFALVLSVISWHTYAVETQGDAGDDEPLPPDQAYQLSAYMINDNTLRAEWTIHEGYYMYRTKFQFSTGDAGLTLQSDQAQYPKGKIKEDEFFGKVETYRHQVAIDIPVTRTNPQLQSFTLDTVSQGCADIGVCYPPQKVAVKVNFPSVGAAATADPEATPLAEPAGSNAFNQLKSLGASLGLNTGDEDFLPVDQAFSYTSAVVDGNHIHVRWDIGKGYYLYRDKFTFALQDVTGVTLGDIKIPRGEKKVDESFGEMEVFHNKVEFDLPLQRTSLDATHLTLVANYQGCAEKGFCYPPQTRSLPMQLPAGVAQATGTGTANAAPSDIPLSEQDEIAATLASGNFLLNVITFFGFGLLLAFTPCVFPMVPILSSIIVGQGEQLTTRKAFTMSLVYVLAMAVTYTVAGIVAGLFGENLQAAFQNAWILGTFAGIFVLLSLSMFGFYELQMPNFIQSKLTELSNRQQGGTLIGVGIMGFLSALIVGPCVAAPLAGALIYIGQTGDPYLGGVALFSLSMGMGAPLLAIGTSAGKLLPRAGNWMETVKAIFGVMLLAVAIWMLERVLPGEITLLLWAALAIISGIFLGALEPVGAGAIGWTKFWKGSGIILVVWGILMVIGAASGGTDPLQPLHRLGGSALTAVAVPMGSSGPRSVPTQSGSESRLPFKRIKGLEALERELKLAGTAGKTVMLDFYADWCISCKEMEKYTFGDTRVQAALQDLVLLQADVTDNDAEDKALLKRFKLIGPPSIMFFDHQGQEMRRLRLVGFLKAEEFVKRVELAKQN